MLMIGAPAAFGPVGTICHAAVDVFMSQNIGGFTGRKVIVPVAGDASAALTAKVKVDAPVTVTWKMPV